MAGAIHLRKKLFLFQGVALALLCALIVAIVAVPLYQHLTREVEDRFTTETNRQAAAISQWISHAKGLSMQITSRTRIRQELQKFNQGKISLPELVDFTRPKLNDAMRISEEIKGITRYDINGHKVVSLGISPPSTTADTVIAPPQDVLLGDPFTRQGRLYIWLMAPIKDREEIIVGTDILVVSTDRLRQIFRYDASPIKSPTVSCALLAYRKGKKFLEVLPNAVFDSESGIDRLIETILTTAYPAMEDHQSARFNVKNLFCVSVPAEDWVLITGLDKDRLYAAVRASLRKAGAFVVILYVLFLFGYKKLLNPLTNSFLLRHEELESRIDAQTATLQKELKARLEAEEAIRRSESMQRKMVANIGDVIGIIDENGAFKYRSPNVKRLFGWQPEEIIGLKIGTDIHPEDLPSALKAFETLKLEPDKTLTIQCRYRGKEGLYRWIEITGTNLLHDPDINGILINYHDITERKLSEDRLEKRMTELTRPMDDPEGITFETLFNIQDIQQLQNQISEATGVASIITHTDGRPITRASNFCRLCNDIIRKTEKGRLNCYKSDAVLGKYRPGGPTIQPCLSGGLWDAGAGISVGGRHIANWLIGQVRDDTQDDNSMRAYAREIGVDEDTFLEAFHEVPQMTRDRFEAISRALFTLANQLSETAYHNLQQARFIDEKQRAEEKLRQSEEKLKAIFEANPDPVVVYDENGFPLYLNDAFTRVFGWRIDELKGQRIPFVPEDQKEITSEKIREIYASGEPVQFETQRLSRRGNPVDVLLSAAIIKSTRGINNGLVVNLTDITERKKLDRQLRQAQKLESIGTLAGGIAHDFNNILSGIFGFSELAKSNIRNEKKALQHIDQIVQGAKRAAELVQQILAFGRQSESKKYPLDAYIVVKEVLKLIRSTIPSTIEIKEQVYSKSKIEADPTQFHQVVMNLCTNAYHAMNETGGILTVGLHDVEIPEGKSLPHLNMAPGKYLKLEVGDNGSGIDENVLNKIFDPFFTTKKPGKGTGLGLAVVDGIIKDHNGFIDVHSKIGEGSLFEIFMPVIASDIPSRQPEEKKGPTLSGSERIMLVDDEKPILNTLQLILKRKGYHIQTFPNGASALEAFSETPDLFDLLITDMTMPGMTGEQLVRDILHIRNNLPVILCTGYNESLTEEKIKKLGISKYLLKPIDTQLLLTSIREVLDGSP